MKQFLQPLVAICICLVPIAAARADEPKSITLKVTGLFMPEREADLRSAVENAGSVKLESIDFDRAEVAFSYDPATEPFKDPDPEKLKTAIDQLLKGNSNHTFGAQLPSGIPKDKLERVEIPVAGLDCKACSYAAYRAIFQIEGVVRATASFKAGMITALIDPTKTNRPALQEALKQRGVDLKEAAR